MSQLAAILRKETLLRWRTRGQAAAILVFGAVTLLLFSFAVGPDSMALRRHAAGFLWLGLLLASTLALGESFHVEMEQGSLEGQLLLPADARSIFYGKALANTLQLALLGLALVPLAVGLYDAGTARVPALCGVIVLGAGALSAPGTLYAGMVAQVPGRETLLPLLLFPLVVPALLAAVKATSLLILGDAMGELAGWVALLVACNGIYWPLCGLLFGPVVDG
jgi:heme exporter protein B